MTDEKRRSENVDTRDLTPPERLATTFRAVVQGVAHETRGEHETAPGALQTVDLGQASRIIGEWAEPQRKVAEQMMDKYGPPNEATASKLIWYRNGAWKRTEISADVVAHNWPAPHTDFLTQVIDYRVPPEMFHLVAMFDGSMLADRTRGELWARCDSEAANVLGMNMVHEIVTGARTYEEAREVSSQQTVAYNLGRPAPYAERLQFEVPEGGTEDLDQPTIGGAVVQQAVGKLKDVVLRRGEDAADRENLTTA